MTLGLDVFVQLVIDGDEHAAVADAGVAVVELRLVRFFEQVDRAWPSAGW